MRSASVVRGADEGVARSCDAACYGRGTAADGYELVWGIKKMGIQRWGPCWCCHMWGELEFAGSDLAWDWISISQYKNQRRSPWVASVAHPSYLFGGGGEKIRRNETW